MEVGLHRDVVDEYAKEPVEGEHGGVNAVLAEVGAQPGQLFRQELLQYLLVHLDGRRIIIVKVSLVLRQGEQQCSVAWPGHLT